MAEAPSKVIHVRNVANDTAELTRPPFFFFLFVPVGFGTLVLMNGYVLFLSLCAPDSGGCCVYGDLVELVKPFGAVAKIKMLRGNNQMEDTGASASAVEHYTGVQANIKGRDVYLQFSSYQELTEHDQVSQASRSYQESQPNRILLVSVRNMNYPITVEVLHQVFSVEGFVQKIVIFQTSAEFQALVQYESQESAKEAKDMLRERNIYDGYCNLDIQFSKQTELEVKYNNDRSRDFTNPSLPTDKRRRPSQVGYGDSGSIYSIQPGAGVAFAQMENEAAIAAAFGDGEGLPPGITGTNLRCTIFASNLQPDKIDENKLFNLFSLYGNIIRFQILRHKQDQALIEMADGFQAELAVYFLKGAMLFGKPLDVTYSKFEHVIASPDTHEFAGSNLNRFNSTEELQSLLCTHQDDPCVFSPSRHYKRQAISPSGGIRHHRQQHAVPGQGEEAGPDHVRERGAGHRGARLQARDDDQPIYHPSILLAA